MLKNTNKNSSIFVGGLKATFTEETLSTYFKKFGKVESIYLKKKKGKQINKGFCIVKFTDENSADRALKVKDHYINKRLVSCRKYLKGSKLKESRAKKNERKIYINGITPEITNEDITKFFESFGKVETGYSLKDEKTGLSKDFGFVVFEEEGVVNKVLSFKGDLVIKGVKIVAAKFGSHNKEKEGEEAENQIIKEENQNKKKFNGKSSIIGNCSSVNFNRSEALPHKNSLNNENKNVDANPKKDSDKHKEIIAEKKIMPKEEILFNKKKSGVSGEWHLLKPTQKAYHEFVKGNFVEKIWHDNDISNLILISGYGQY